MPACTFFTRLEKLSLISLYSLRILQDPFAARTRRGESPEETRLWEREGKVLLRLMPLEIMQLNLHFTDVNSIL